MQRPTFRATSLTGPFLVVLAVLTLALPSYWDLAQSVWLHEEQSYGPVILMIALWLLWRKRGEWLRAHGDGPVSPLLYAALACAALAYALGRSQAIVQLESLAVILFLACALALYWGPGVLRWTWFPLFLLLFTIPLPGVAVQTVTLPLKSAVSLVSEVLLHAAGYPVARTGVILSIGQYQLLVADACAGMASIFTLEAIGLVYLEWVQRNHRWHRILLAVAVVPCAFVANVVRVCVLVLITFHFGSAAGAGFMHSFAGILLFAVAVMGIVLVDHALDVAFRARSTAPHVAVQQ